MMKTFLPLFLTLAGFLHHQGTQAYIGNSCQDVKSGSTVLPAPTCANNLAQVTDKLPRCVVPIDNWLSECRSIPVKYLPPNERVTVPTWFDQKWSLRGQQVTSEFRFAWYLNMFNGLLVEMNMPDILHPLIFNKQNTDARSAATRDLATIMQGMVWTKDYLWRLPKAGGNWLTSIETVRRRHASVQFNGNDRLQNGDAMNLTKCLIDPSDYDVPTKDDVWDAVEADLAASSKLSGPGERDPPQTTWPTCPDTTTCNVCGDRCSPNCVDICAVDPDFRPLVPFAQGSTQFLKLTNVEITNATLYSGTTFDATFTSVYFSDGEWVNGTRADGAVFRTSMQSGNITSATVAKGRFSGFRPKIKFSGGSLEYTLYVNGTLQAGTLTNVTLCDVIATNCTDCVDCTGAAWTPPTCYYSDPELWDCGNCLCDPDGLSCTNCTTCNNDDTCLPFPIPLYNQQAMSFVVYNLVGFVLMDPDSIGFSTACDKNLWAFNHLWAVILSALGVEDKCNLLLQPDLATAKTYYTQVFDRYVLPTLFKFPKQTRFLMENVFEGLKLLTVDTFTQELLLCRFLKDFLHLPEGNNLQTCQKMSPMSQGIDQKVFPFLDLFKKLPIYRALVNIGMDDLFYFQANVFMPSGNCTSYPKIATGCMV